MTLPRGIILRGLLQKHDVAIRVWISSSASLLCTADCEMLTEPSIKRVCDRWPPDSTRKVETRHLKKGGLSIVLRAHSITYDHTIWKARDPVRSPLVKPDRAGLVVGSVTTSESPVLYVFCPFFASFLDPFDSLRHRGILFQFTLPQNFIP